MARTFERFVILADMRTGSNALEERLNDYEGVRSHGEVFNPKFIGHAGEERLFGISRSQRDTDPAGMLAALASNTDGVPGFRLFSDHDRRVLDMCLRDRRCAKVVLTRSPLDSYISLKIARKTGQWWLGDFGSAKSGKTTFDREEFERYLAARSEWLRTIRRALKISGQTAFEIEYDDLGDDDVIAGLARFVGAGKRRTTEARKGRVQNPVPMSEKVTNFADMRAALQGLDPFDLDAVPDREPPRGPNVPAFVACRRADLLYMPVRCAGDLRVKAWMAALDGCKVADLETAFTRKSLRHWKRHRGQHTSFTVVTHPVERAHDAFCRYILPTEQEAFPGIREILMQSYKLPVPDDPEDASYDAGTHQEAFLAFLKFLKGNLGGQTAVRIDAAWASQEVCLRGFAEFALPDAVLRAETLARDLPDLAVRLGVKPPPVPDATAFGPFSLARIYDQRIERAARAAYQRDYMMFGYGAWA